MDKVAKIEAVRRRASKVISENDLSNKKVTIYLILALSILPTFHGLDFQKRYILINKVLSKIEQKGGKSK